MPIYQSLIRSLLEYACPVWHCVLPRSLEGLQRRALRIALPDCSYSEALESTGMPTLADRRDDLSRHFFQAMLSPSNKLNHMLPTQREVCYGLRSLKNYDIMIAQEETLQENSNLIRAQTLAVTSKQSDWSQSCPLRSDPQQFTCPLPIAICKFAALSAQFYSEF